MVVAKKLIVSRVIEEIQRSGSQNVMSDMGRFSANPSSSGDNAGCTEFLRTNAEPA
jgi:hypothetical protein